MNKKLFTSGIILIVLSSLIYAYTLTTWSNGNSDGDIVFSPNKSGIYRNLSFPNWAYVTKAEIDLNGTQSFKRYENCSFPTSTNMIAINDTWYHVATFSTGNTGDNESFDIENISLQARHDASDFSTVRNGTLTLNLTATNSSGHPTGATLDYGSINTSIIPYTIGRFNVTMNETYYLTKGIRYAITIKYDGNESLDVIRFSYGLNCEGMTLNRFANGVWTGFGGDLGMEIYGYSKYKPTNITVKTNNEITYQNLSTINTTRTVDLNTTSLNDCIYACANPVGTNCTCEINFSSVTVGTLEYSDLDMEYSTGDLDNCSIHNVTSLNITFLNESNSESVTADFEIVFDFGVDANSLLFNYSNQSDNVQNHSFCINNPNTNLYTDILIDYDIGGTTYEYSTSGLALTNATQVINLYSTTGTTRVTFTVKDLYDSNIEDAYVKIMKYDIGDDAYKTVEVIKTNADGEATGNIVLYTEWYRFIVDYNGITYRVTDPEKIFSTTKTLRIDLTDTDWFANYDTTIGAYTYLNFTNSTLNFRYTWNDPSGAMHEGCLQVVMINRSHEVTICDNCTSSTAATILCYIGPDVAGKRYIAQGYFKYDLIYITDYLEKFFDGAAFTPLWEKGDEAKEYGVFLSFIIILALCMVGIWNPIAGIALTLVGFFIASTLGFLALPLSALITLVLLGLIVIFRISRSS